MACVEIYHISNARTTTINSPVMPIKRCSIAMDGSSHNPGLREGHSAYPSSIFKRALGLLSLGLPLKLTSCTPPQASPPRPDSHFIISAQARSLTAL